MRWSLAAVLTAAVSVLAACGDGPHATSASTTSASEVATSAATATPTPTPTATPTPTPSATPVSESPGGNATDVKGGKITVVGTEFKFDPDAISAKAGKVEVTLDNQGSAPHEIVFLKTNAEPGSLTAGTDGRVPEKGSVGEVSEIPGGQTKSATISFKPGNYVFVCNVPGHYQAGMHGSLVVR